MVQPDTGCIHLVGDYRMDGASQEKLLAYACPCPVHDKRVQHLHRYCPRRTRASTADSLSDRNHLYNNSRCVVRRMVQEAESKQNLTAHNTIEAQ